MTAQEQQMLQGLVDRINKTQLTEKDPEAEQYIQQTLGQNPDAPYVLAQTVLVQGYALEQAQKQIADLRGQLAQARRQAQEPKHTGSFLGNLLGHKDEPQRTAPPPPPPPPPPQGYPSPQGYGAAPMYVPSGGYPLPGQPQGGGFLQSAMQTAAGVAAGALAFEGIESLMHGFGHAAGYGSGFDGGLGGGRPEEVINNYYGDSAQHEHRESSGGDDRNFYNPSSDASRSDTGSASSERESFHDTSTDNRDDGGTSADDLSGTTASDYSSDGDDSMLADDVGGDQQDFDGGFDSGGDDTGGDFDSGGGGDDSGF